jgi:hypothetical protein
VVGFGASMALVRPKRDVRIVADEDVEAGPPPAA